MFDWLNNHYCKKKRRKRKDSSAIELEQKHIQSKLMSLLLWVISTLLSTCPEASCYSTVCDFIFSGHNMSVHCCGNIIDCPCKTAALTNYQTCAKLFLSVNSKGLTYPIYRSEFWPNFFPLQQRSFYCMHSMITLKSDTKRHVLISWTENCSCGTPLL